MAAKGYALQMKVHRSNRMEFLIDALAEELQASVGSPFVREPIIVHSLGMERWVSQQLALRLGIAANLDFPFPSRAIRDILHSATADQPEDDPWEIQRLTWRIVSALPGLLPQEAFSPIRHYLGSEEQLYSARGYSLASRIAEAFSRLLIYRPEQILAWESGDSSDWSASLWRALLHPDKPHLVHLTQNFLEELAAGHEFPLPHRISLFGISTLAPLHLRILQALSARTPVHLYVLAPSQEYWGDLQSRRAILREAAKTGRAMELASAGVAEGLLASTGRLGRDFQALLESDGQYVDGKVAFESPGEDTLLHSLQTSVIHFHALKCKEPDSSVQVHSCHGPTRQAEVLHNLLLDRFNQDPSLQPRDVVIMTPKLPTYGPLVEAVFGRATQGGRGLPFQIADRSALASHPTVAAFLRLLQGIGQRTTATLLYERLSAAATAARFDLDSEELTQIRDWLLTSGVRWGLNADERAQHGQPALREHTWEFGLDRILSGFALGAEPAALIGDVWPFTDLEGADGQTLGKLLAFVESYQDNALALQSAGSPADWRNRLLKCANDWLADPEGHEGGLLRLRDAIQTWTDQIEDTALPLAFDAVRASITAHLEGVQSGTSFLGGAITVCAMVPMRSVPFRLVVLLGMDEQDFPRRSVRMPFVDPDDAPRLGDRSPREDDRYSFLEALLSARDAFWALYTGRNPHTNDIHGPSPVIAELLECLPAEWRTQVVHEHAIQSFSPSNFNGPFRQFDPIAAAGASALTAPDKHSPPSFIAHALPSVSGQVSLEVFKRVLADPTKELLKTRLGMALADDTPGLQDREPLQLDGLASYEVRHQLVGHLLAGRSHETAKRAIRGAGLLPPGNAGNEVLEQEFLRAVAYVEQVRHVQGGEEVAPFDVHLPFERIQLVGRLRGIYPNGLVRGNPSALRGKRLLDAWIDHLISQVSRAPASSWMVTSSANGAFVQEFIPVESASTLLENLVSLFEKATSEPIPFEAQRSAAFSRLLLTHLDSKEAVKRLNQQERLLRTRELNQASKSIQRLMGRITVWNTEVEEYEAREGKPFHDLAVRVFHPLYHHLKTR